MDDVEDQEEGLSIHKERCVYDGAYHPSIHDKFTSFIVKLDGSYQSDLDWKDARQKAQELVLHGKRICWDIDLGIGGRSDFSFLNTTQCLSLCVAIDHFRDTLWNEFKNHTEGLIIYRGSSDFSDGFRWEQTLEENYIQWLNKRQREVINDPYHRSLYCRDVIVEYLSLLVSRVPEEVFPMVLLEVINDPDSPLKTISTLHPDKFDHLNLALKYSTPLFSSLGWQSDRLSLGYIGTDFEVATSEYDAPVVGMCLPAANVIDHEEFSFYHSALIKLRELSCPCKLLSESQVMSQWEGLDEIIYDSKVLTPSGIRQIKGFCASGGKSVFLQNSQGFIDEVSFTEWIKHRRS